MRGVPHGALQFGIAASYGASHRAELHRLLQGKPWPQVPVWSACCKCFRSGMHPQGQEHGRDGFTAGHATIGCPAGDWDSEETGTDETGTDSDAEPGEALPLKAGRAGSEADSGKSSTVALAAKA